MLTYIAPNGPRAGLLLDDRIMDTGALVEQFGKDLKASIDWSSNRAILAGGPVALTYLKEAIESNTRGELEELSLDDVELTAPVPDPEKILCLGLNYRAHAEESEMVLPSAPVLFGKYPNSLVGPSAPIILPAVSEKVDYEGELGVVVGVTAKDVPEEWALEYVAGAIVFNDVTARDLQHQTSQWMAGKAIDTFAPCGPTLVTLDELGDLEALRIRTRLNGETVQDGDTSELIYGVAATIAFLSQFMTLKPGDIIATGTPAGVGIRRKPPLLMRPGDRIEVEIDGIGVISNPIVGPAAGSPVATSGDGSEASASVSPR